MSLRLSTLLWLVVASGTFFSTTASAQDEFLGMWKGRLGPTTVLLDIEESDEGDWRVVLYDLGRNAFPMVATVEDIGLEEVSLRFEVQGARLSGALNEEGDALELEWKDGGGAVSIVLTRSEPDLLVVKRKGFVLPEGMNPAAPMETAQFAFLIGEWHGTYPVTDFQGRTGTRTLVWTTDWILDGMAIQNTSRTSGAPGTVEEGRTVQFGLDTRIYSAQRKRWEHTYVDAMGGPILSIYWQMKDGELVSTPAPWVGGDGVLATHIIKFRDIEKDRFIWSLDRSLDGGKTWQKDYQVIVNKRVR